MEEMTNEEKKRWILKHWRVMSRGKITEALRRYWLRRETPSEDIFEAAQRIFGVEAGEGGRGS